MAIQPAIGRLFEDDGASREDPIECLGLTFESDEERRAYFLERLREKLQDPAFRQIEGFPIGSDEDILALSDPPYYTACPNPFFEDFISHYGTPYEPDQPYSREPFAVDVSEGKNDPIYNAHSYHTKVPHKAIMHYILHYTEPGDIVFDGFCGTGMTGVAAQLCRDRKIVESLGYQVLDDGSIRDDCGNVLSQIGARKALLSDLSPFATVISAGYNDFSPHRYNTASVVGDLNKLRSQWNYLYDTQDPNTAQHGQARFYIWSEVFTCPHCSLEKTLFDFAVDRTSYTLRAKFSCPSCGANLNKDDLSRVWHSVLDLDGRTILREAQAVLTEVAATMRNGDRRYPPTSYDLRVIDEIGLRDYAWLPDASFPFGRQTRKVKSGSGISKVHQMFTPRALVIISHAWELARQTPLIRDQRAMLFLLTATLTLLSRRERYRDGTGKGAQSGTLYVPSLQVEKNAFDVIERKRDALSGLNLNTDRNGTLVSVQSHGDLQNIPSSSINYIFTDPPFGESLQYGELNFFHESWLKVWTRIEEDCVLNYVHKKDLVFYHDLMRKSFSQARRILMPGRWITVEFHNSQNSVWMAIQEALWQAGFTVADVRILDKHFSFR